jgi:hypothetical protein
MFTNVLKIFLLLSSFFFLLSLSLSYTIRDLTEEEKEAKISKDVKKLRKYEETMLKHYQAFLQVLESILQGLINIFSNCCGGSVFELFCPSP